MRIVMDDAGDVPAELAQELNIRVVPVNIMFGTEQFLSGVEMDQAAFYAKTAEVTAENFPKTSQPTPYQFEQVYREILAEGENEILTITVSEKLSGTYASAIAAARELEGQGTFHLFDSQAGSAAQGYMAIEAARMAQAGESIDAIMARLHKMREEMAVVFTIDSLEYAVKGGRVSSMKSVMASLLNIKPILRLEDGLIVEAGRVRTRKKAIGHIIDMVATEVGNKPVRVAYIHANAADEAKILAERARSVLNVSEELVVDMAVAVAINLGPGALGLVAIPV
ncbi:MAG: DegV family protein [Chloroflexi bacterium]|nr:MAG: DegV family protein [Chloroflexota bacterium]